MREGDLDRGRLRPARGVGKHPWRGPRYGPRQPPIRSQHRRRPPNEPDIPTPLRLPADPARRGGDPAISRPPRPDQRELADEMARRVAAHRHRVRRAYFNDEPRGHHSARESCRKYRAPTTPPAALPPARESARSSMTAAGALPQSRRTKQSPGSARSHRYPTPRVGRGPRQRAEAAADDPALRVSRPARP